MFGLYANWITNWEYELATRDRNRQVRPFEWGADWLDGLSPNGDPRKAVMEYVRRSIRDSERFFTPAPVQDYRLENNVLRFTSPIQSPYPENNTVYADFFPVENGRGRAVVVLPQWNSDIHGHVGLCKLLNKFGITALRMSKAYHDRRMPAELERADYHMSSNVGRTINAVQQSVQDLRSCLTWLERRGYERLAVLGTSLGSCVSFIAAAHDSRVSCGVFNHVSMNVGDVVWTGLSTQHVRKGIEGVLNQDELREFWSVISPASYMDRMAERNMPALLVWARYDSTFLPEYSLQVLKQFRERNLPHKVFTLPCAHYTTGRFPFNWMDGLAMCRFLRARL